MMRLPLLAGVLLPLLAGPLLAQDTAGPMAPGDPPSRVARVADLKGVVSMEAPGDTTWGLVGVNYPISTGERLYADRGARAELQVGPYAVRLGESADVTVTNLTDGLLQLGLAQGVLRISVYEFGADDSIEVDTPHGALALLATGEYRIDASAGDTALLVSVSDGGSLQWTAGGVAQNVASGQAILVSGYNPIQVASVAFPGDDDFDRWSDARDRGLNASPSAQYVSRDIPGYQDLDDAGTWHVDVTYGPVWYPTVVPAGWVPYRYGRWVWVDPWGWTWVEQEPWGYAPFHYGRWVVIGARWCWIPGPVVPRPYYAPALVVFVNGGAYAPGAQAWFPLGPGEPYHPWYHHDRDYLRRVNETNLRGVRDVDVLIQSSRGSRFVFKNRRATTVVTTNDFETGRLIGRRALPVRPQLLSRAAIVPHPFALPTVAATVGGTRQPRPPAPRRPTFVNAPAPRTTPALLPNQPLIVRRAVPQEPAAPAPGAPAPTAPAGDQGRRAVPAPTPALPGTPAPRPSPVLITRNPPPPPTPSFQERRKAMAPDAGRPLEPQQIQNLQRGKPAGPQRDTEVPPHPAAQRRAAPAPRAQPAAPRAPGAPKPQAQPKPKEQDRRRPGPGN